jgi:Cu+-exporting ATPase
VLKGPGDPVTAGTVNTGNSLVIRATRVGSDTTLAQIVKLVEKAQMSKAPVQAVADTVSSVFVPIVISLASLTWLLWWVCAGCRAYVDGWSLHACMVGMWCLSKLWVDWMEHTTL